MAQVNGPEENEGENGSLDVIVIFAAVSNIQEYLTESDPRWFYSQ